MVALPSSTMAARSGLAAAALWQASLAAPASAPSLKDSLSGVFGSVSLTAWICLLLPQLIQNYKSQSADGLSMAFLIVWLFGDVTNLLGALWTGLAPTAVALAAYFCVADLILIGQCLYYNMMNASRQQLLARRSLHHRRCSSSTAVAGTADGADAEAGREDGAEPETEAESESESDALLPDRRLRRQSSASIGLPGSHLHRSTRRSESGLDPLRRIVTGEDDAPDSNPWLHNAFSLLAVWLVGAAGYFASHSIGAWDAPSDNGDASALGQPHATLGLVLGYFSAVCYLCARVPQIIKNYREKSCEGLALLFFLLSLTGNCSYGASLVAYSQDRAYLLKALPWLMGSLGTIVEDCVIFVQFRIYAPKRNNAVKAAPGTAVETATASGVVGSYGAA